MTKKLKLGKKEIEFAVNNYNDEVIIEFNNHIRGLVALWQPSWHEAYVLRRDGEIIHLSRTYKGQPIPIHLEMVELGIDNYVIVYRIDNKFGEYGFIEV